MGEKRWYIFQESEKPRLMTAASIREALRNGNIDPFDIVSPEQNPEKKRELVNFPEIFQPSTESKKEGDKPPLQPFNEPTTVQAPGPNFGQGTGFEKEKFDAIKPVLEIQESKKALSSSEFGGEPDYSSDVQEKIQPRPTGKKLKKKNFFLHRKDGKKMGPLSATEIQSLFYRGVLPKSVKVGKSGSDRKIRIRQFVSAYADSRMKSIAVKQQFAVSDPTKAGKIMPSSRVINELYRVASARKLAKKSGQLRLMVACVVSAIFVFSAYSYISRSPTNIRKSDSGQVKSGVKKRSLIEAKRPGKVSSRNQKSSSVTNKKGRPKKKMITRVKNPAQRQKAIRSAKKRAHLKPIADLSLIPEYLGRNIKVGPLFFSKRALSVCGSKCTLRFADKSGNRLKVRFFKSAFERALMRINNGAYLSGVLTQDSKGFVLRLSAVN